MLIHKQESELRYPKDLLVVGHNRKAKLIEHGQCGAPGDIIGEVGLQDVDHSPHNQLISGFVSNNPLYDLGIHCRQ